MDRIGGTHPILDEINELYKPAYEDVRLHCVRVAKYALWLYRILSEHGAGGKISLSYRDILDALTYHDIGKTAIPRRIICKRGKLNEDERLEMETHPYLGLRILRHYRGKAESEAEKKVLSLAMEVACTHHERWDGSGYPYGLKGEEIPLLGRICAVADAYDAITSDRAYQKKLSPSYAFMEVKKGAGGQFDPLLAEVFFSHRDTFYRLWESLKG